MRERANDGRKRGGRWLQFKREPPRISMAHHARALGVIWGGPRVVAPGDGPHSRLPLALKHGVPVVYSYCWHTILVREGYSRVDPIVHQVWAPH
jgi:hypothetical protein